VTRVLQPFAIPQCTLHQDRDGSLRLALARSGLQTESIRQALLDLFGSGQRLQIETVDGFEGKVVQYTSDLCKERP
jgi:hypothetical protein